MPTGQPNSRVMELADCLVRHLLVPERHERHPTGSSLRTIDELAAHDSAAHPELVSDLIQAQFEVQVSDVNFDFPRSLGGVHAPLRRAAVITRSGVDPQWVR